MFESTQRPSHPPDDLLGNEALDLILELEKSTPQAVKQKRAHARVTLRVKVVLRPGNYSQRDDWSLEGVSGDLSAGGCQLLFPRPVTVGDVFHITFEGDGIDVAPRLAMCRRCRYVRDEAFEAGFTFFQLVDLLEALGPQKGREAS